MPKKMDIEKHTHDSKILERSTGKKIVRRSMPNDQALSKKRLSDLYKELIHSKAETRPIATPNYYVVKPESEYDRLSIIRQGFKKFAEENRHKILEDLGMEYQSKLAEVKKLENITNISKEVLNNIFVGRTHAENVMQQTLKQCNLLLEQLGYTQKQEDSINILESSMESKMTQKQP